MKTIYKKSLKLHKKHNGKLSVESKIKLRDKSMLSMAYTPGVAAVCKAIAKDKNKARDYTIKRNTVAIVTDGSAVLGLGDLGPLASLPVMEGKAALFKEFGKVDAFPICLDTKDTEEIIKIIKNISPVFGGINLEDISAPRCFEIEERLRKELSIPIMHDDQWGAATVTLAALINANKLRGGDIKDLRIVLSGVGAAGVATARLLHSYGIKKTLFIDSKGVINNNRKNLTKEKISLLKNSKLKNTYKDLPEALVGSDVFIGLSKPNVLTKDMIKTMAKNPIIFALANPDPEIDPKIAKEAGAFIIATGRSDYKNQINNSLVFPNAFKAMLDYNIKQFNNNIFIKIAEALAKSVKNPTTNKIIPSMFDENARKNVYEATASMKDNIY